MTSKSTVLQNLPADLDRDRLPKHVAVIMDGNVDGPNAKGYLELWVIGGWSMR